MAEIKSHKDDILSISKRYGVSDIRVFGSVARGEQGPTSDLDLIISLGEGRSLLDRIGFMQDVGALLNVRVDAVNENALNELIKASVLKDVVEV